MTRIRLWCVLVLSMGIVVGCAAGRTIPSQSDNICDLFAEKGKWFRAADQVSRRWRIPIPVLLAIMHQESKFAAKARPPRTTCCFFLPGPRPSSAYGYAQALDTTWAQYRQAVANPGADRDNFADALDFIGWYCHRSHVQCGIPVTDAYSLYLAYHEGQGGYTRRTYSNKHWLQQVARKVQRRATTYTRQFTSCENSLRRSGKCCLWPF